MLACATLVYASPNSNVLSADALSQIPFDDGFNDQGDPDEQAIRFRQEWQGKQITMVMGGVKQTENYAWCDPAIKGARPQSIVTGKLISRPRGGSGGNMLILNHCKVLKK